jgi:hypothetical protein
MTETLIPTAVTEQGEYGPTVYAEWTGVDRPRTYGIVAGKHAARLARAINAGVVFHDPKVITDVDGNTFVSAASRVRGRTLNADLKRLGF